MGGHREPAACPECGEVHLECSRVILDGMSLNAIHDARERLSAEGFQALRMVSHAVDTLGIEAYDIAENVEALPLDEVRVIVLYLARKTMIDAAREELYEQSGEEGRYFT